MRQDRPAVLDRGGWNGKQIVSADWIAQSVKPRFQAIGYFAARCSTAINGAGRSLAEARK